MEIKYIKSKGVADVMQLSKQLKQKNVIQENIT